MGFLDEFKGALIEGNQEFDLIPNGEYEAIIDNTSLDISKTPARLSLTYKIVTGEFKNRKVWSNYTMQGRGLGFLKKDMKTLGLDYSGVSKEEDVAKLMFSQVGRGVEIFIKQSEYNGKTYNNAYLNSAERLVKSDTGLLF